MRTFLQIVTSFDRVSWGWFFLVLGSVFFMSFFYAAIISKFLPLSDNVVISAIQNDSAEVLFARFIVVDLRYYCFLVPLTLPILVIAIYFHWLSMKLFKHA